MEALAGIIREALVVTAVLCFPVLIVATGVGTAVAVVQAATQIQEQTLTLLPKMLAVGAMVALCGAFGLDLCASLFQDAIRELPHIVRGGA
jgi:flagellar biosynthetic protein FliQ